MARKTKKTKQGVTPVQKTVKHHFTVLMQVPNSDVKDWLLQKVETEHLDIIIVGENTEASDNQKVSFLPENASEAYEQLQGNYDEETVFLTVNSQTTKEDLEVFFQNKGKSSQDKIVTQFFSTPLATGFLQKMWLFFLNFIYSLNLNGLPLNLALIPNKELSVDDFYTVPRGRFTWIARLLKNHPNAKEALLGSATDKLTIQDFIKAKTAFLYFFFFEKFILPLKQLKDKANFIRSVGQGNHPIYKLLYHTLFLCLLVLFPLLSFDYGITWDEPVLSDYADDILKYYASDGENKEVFDMQKHARNATMHYSASFDVIAALLHKYISPFGIYETRHLLNALMGVLAILFSARIGRELGSWRTGFLVMVFMLLSPRYFGHSMNNPKDIPFLLGYAAGLYYMIRFFKQLPSPSPTTVFWVTISMAFMISVKIGGLIIIGLFGLFSGVYWLYEGFKNSWKEALGHLPKYLIYLGAIIFVSYLLGIWFWPWGYEKPFENPFVSLTEFTNFRFLITYELFEGERINMETPPWYYTFKWIGITAPLFVLLGFVFSITNLILDKGISKKAIVLLLLFAFFFPVVYTIVQNSTLYSGWRHLMFVYVPLVALAASGWELLFETKQKWMPITASVILLILSVSPLFWIVKNHPNQYVYFNEFTGGINGAYKEYETEYWCNSMKQAVDWIVEHEEIGEEKIRIAANFEITTAQYFANKYPEKIQMLWTRENEKYKQNWDYAFFGTRGMPKSLIEASFPPKGTIHTIKADTVPLLAIVKSENNFVAQAFKLREQNKRNEALEVANKAVAFESNNVEAQRIKGMLQIDLNQNDQAIRTLSKVISLNPDDFVAYTLAGIAYNRKKQYEDAIRLFNKAIDLKINNTSGYLNRGRAYMALKNFNLALENFQEAAKYDNGRNPRIFVEASIALLQQGMANPQIKRNRFELAIKNMQVALEMNPNQQDVYKNLVFAYQELGDKTNALKYQNMLMGK